MNLVYGILIGLVIAVVTDSVHPPGGPAPERIVYVEKCK